MCGLPLQRAALVLQRNHRRHAAQRRCGAGEYRGLPIGVVDGIAAMVPRLTAAELGLQRAGELSSWAEHSPGWPPASLPGARAAVTGASRYLARAARSPAGRGHAGRHRHRQKHAGQRLGRSRGYGSAGTRRPTTRQPTLVCRPGLRLAMLGIDPDSVHLVERDLPVLHDLVLLDCPDPDTTEDASRAGQQPRPGLRELLPHCDVLLVTTTQQKYRSAG